MQGVKGIVQAGADRKLIKISKIVELGNNACCTPVEHSKMKLKNINKTGAYGILQYAKR